MPGSVDILRAQAQDIRGAMPSLLQAQAQLFRAAEHGASFPMAKKVRGSMSLKALHEFASTKSKNLPKHVKPKRRAGY